MYIRRQFQMNELDLSDNNLIAQLNQVTFSDLIDTCSIQADLNKLVLAQSRQQSQLELASYINVNCSYTELLTLFQTHDGSQYIANLKELYGSAFVRGNIIHTDLQRQLSIRQSTFRSILKTYQWIYMENYRYTTDGIIITINTINGDPTQMLNGITAAYIIKILPTEENLRRNLNFNIMFKGKVINGSRIDKKQLKLMANSLNNVPLAITNRQIIVQHKACLTKCSVNNNYCVSCIKPIFCYQLPYFKSRCGLCAYNICKSCSHPRTLYNKDKYETIIVCSRCLVRLKYCNYSNVDESTVTHRSIMLDDEGHDAGQSVYTYLIDHMEDNPCVKALVKKILKLGNEDSTSTREQIDTIDRNTLKEYLTSHPPLEDCNVSTASGLRSYPIGLPPTLRELDRMITPKPHNEEDRLNAVKKLNIANLIRNKELMQICEIVNAELQNLSTLIVMIINTQMCVVASNDPSFIQFYDKDESICQHMLMDGKPLLVTNPEADMKFYNFPSIRTLDIKFYFSVPVFSPDNYIIASFCTIDTSVKRITVSQYSMMRKLSELVAMIINDPNPVVLSQN